MIEPDLISGVTNTALGENLTAEIFLKNFTENANKCTEITG